VNRVENIYNAKIEQVQNRVNAKLSKFGVQKVDFAQILGLAQEEVPIAGQTDYSLRPYTGTELKAYTNENTYNELIEEKSRKYEVDPDLVKAFMRGESNFLKRAHSRSDAKGLMQLMPGTAKDMGVTNAFDPVQCVDGGTKYIKMMLDRFGDERLAVAAYYTGPNRVKSYNITDPDNQSQYNRLSDKTRSYVANILSYRDVYAKY